MQYTLRQLLNNPFDTDLLSNDAVIRLKTDLEHFINHEHVLTQRIRLCQTALQLGNYPDDEMAGMKDEIIQHQTTILQLHTLYGHVCNRDYEYNALSTP